MPGRELADAALVLVGGTLLLTPGFVTDIFGFFFVLPFTRPLARRGMSAFFNRRLAGQLGGAGLGGSGLVIRGWAASSPAPAAPPGHPSPQATSSRARSSTRIRSRSSSPACHRLCGMFFGRDLRAHRVT